VNSPVRIGVFGARGRMGQRIIACAEARDDCRIVCTMDAGTETGRVSDCEVLIDFSLPQATDHLLECLEKCSAGLVTGVTGRNETQHAKVMAFSSNRPVFAAANFSLGIAVLNHLVAQAVTALGPDFDTEVFEIHHRLKTDAPSGTALQLAATAAACRGLPWPESRRNREGNTGARSDVEIGTAALRGGTVAGEHTVFLFGQSERIELTHRATDRDVFAIGSLRAARWLVGRAHGLYSMTDLVEDTAN
jgi:4-hydroxy-tetrahydrodipicolinate reductase